MASLIHVAVALTWEDGDETKKDWTKEKLYYLCGTEHTYDGVFFYSTELTAGYMEDFMNLKKNVGYVECEECWAHEDFPLLILGAL